MSDAAAAVERALGDLAGSLARASPGWLALGIVLHLANQVARGRGWYAVMRSSLGDDPALRRRDACAVWIAGAAAGGVLSSRGGDVVRLFLMSRRVPRAGCPVVAGTLVAEGAGELAVGAALVAAAVTLGVGPQLGVPGPVTVVVAACAVALAAWLVWRVPRLRRCAAGVGRGCASLREPRAYARRVLPWQLASRACRLAALGCLLAAFGLPATPVAVLLVVFAQTGGRVLPFGPASVGAGVALLAATFEPVTGTAVPAAQLALFFVGTSTVLTLAGALLTVALTLAMARGRESLDALRAARAASVPAP